MASTADHWTDRPAASAAMLCERSHGTLDAITDSERRALRPIGMSAREAAARTGALLAELLALPSVRIFQGVRPGAANSPRVPHVVSAGSCVIFVESVAWPPGCYSATPAGRIHCDGMYIGQSAHQLIAAVRHWREFLPDGHQVSALVAVHHTSAGDLTLPSAGGQNLAWACGGNVVGRIRAQLPHGRQVTSITAFAALAAATAAE